MGFCGKCFSHWVISLARISSIKTLKNKSEEKIGLMHYPLLYFCLLCPAYTHGVVYLCVGPRGWSQISFSIALNVFSLRQDLFSIAAHCCLRWLLTELPGSSCLYFQWHLQGHTAIPSLSVGAREMGSDPHFLRASTLVTTESSP